MIREDLRRRLLGCARCFKCGSVQFPDRSYRSGGPENRARTWRRCWSGRVDSNHRPLGPEPKVNLQNDSRNPPHWAMHNSSIRHSEPSPAAMAHHNRARFGIQHHGGSARNLNDGKPCARDAIPSAVSCVAMTRSARDISRQSTAVARAGRPGFPVRSASAAPRAPARPRQVRRVPGTRSRRMVARRVAASSSEKMPPTQPVKRTQALGEDQRARDSPFDLTPFRQRVRLRMPA